MPRISVCIPAYNRPGELKILLNSILNQDYDEYEIVVSDDNSPLSEEIRVAIDHFIKKYPKKTIRYFKNNKNLGYDANLRFLIERAEGEYCLFMRNDDLLYIDALSKIVSVLEYCYGLSKMGLWTNKFF